MQSSTSRPLARLNPRTAHRLSVNSRTPRNLVRAGLPASPLRSSPATISRTFFSLPDISKLAGLSSSSSSTEPTGIETDGEQQRFHSRKILPYTQAQLYSLIADVPRYSSFIPFCNSCAVLAKPSGSAGAKRVIETDWKPGEQPFNVEAEMCVGFGGLEETFISRVAGRPFESVTATASDQIPIFKSLVTTWAFAPASPLSPRSTNPSPSPSAREPRHKDSTSQSDTNPEMGPTLLTIDLAFAFINPLHRIASQAVFPKVAERMVEAFEKRCLEVFGKGKE
ncbi:MAG: hypothetical protein TREMPRED_005859 [Tremellales sp. Tagirdzhanova-0007]|nr:MAG: hypothetical protein TREMPRED_005859 [Tremellales sp. Tagirdzhanova-0007]